MRLIQKYKSSIIGIVLGAGMGYLYYFFVGCSNGTCAISSNPINSTLYGALMGAILFYNPKGNKDNNSNNN